MHRHFLKACDLVSQLKTITSLIYIYTPHRYSFKYKITYHFNDLIHLYNNIIKFKMGIAVLYKVAKHTYNEARMIMNQLSLKGYAPC